MQFAPRPENDFLSYIQAYYRECRGRFPQIEAIAGKWMFRDLLPGLSDFDTRFIVSDDMSVEDWCQMSVQVGQAHLELCRKFPGWARNLEHLPGINLTWSELGAEKSYYPEYQQWTFYHTINPQHLSQVEQILARRPWDIKDEYFHLKRFCLYYGRYDRQIDPPINLGIQAVRYPLHSRLMHYFNPPVHSAVCILDQRNYPGKLDAFESAARLFPRLPCWEMIFEILQAHYELPQYYEEPGLTRLEDALEQGLTAIAAALRQVITLVPASAGLEMAAWKKALGSAPIDPAMLLFDNYKFARLMKGRLVFYLNAPPHFDSDWLILNELRRIRSNFFGVPFRTYWKIKTGEEVADPLSILPALQGNPLTVEEVAAARQFARLSASITPGQERQIAAGLVEVYDTFYQALARLTQAA
jgi:hypothetical protein